MQFCNFLAFLLTLLINDEKTAFNSKSSAIIHALKAKLCHSEFFNGKGKKVFLEGGLFVVE
jgi:hypothetical protein